MANRPEIWKFQVKCINKECGDYNIPRTITIPHLGDGVFLMPTSIGTLGLSLFNLFCGVCQKAHLFVAVQDA